MAVSITRPDRTWALVVGVESYQEGRAWDLDGPVPDADRFIRWLRRRGVPASQIVALLSPLDRNRQIVNNLVTDRRIRVKSQAATANALNDAVDQFRGHHGDLLYLFLGGHGIMIDHQRLFLASDADDKNLRNLWLDELFDTLRTTAFEGFPRQVALIDTCADFVLRAELSYNPPKREMRKGEQFTPDQFVLYAAADGEAAANDTNERTGKFSRVMLDWLERVEDDCWPPPIDELAQHVKAHFEKDRRESGAQRPIYIRYRSGQGDEDDLYGSMRECAARMQLIREARQQLDAIPFNADQWAQYYDRTRRYLDRSLPATKSRNEMIQRLASAVAFDSEGRELPRPLFEFMWRVARDREDRRFQSWVESHITNQGELENLKRRVEEESAEPGYHVMIELATSGSGKRAFAESFRWALWCGHQRRPIEKEVCRTNGTPDGVSAALSAILDRLRRERPSERLHLEFFVSHEHLSVDFDHWMHKHAPLGSAFPVSVRSGDLHLQGVRQRYYRKIRANEAVYRQPSIQWLPDNNFPVGRILPHCEHEKDCRALFGFAAPAYSERELYELLETLLDCGAPFMLWPRQPGKRTFKGELNKRISQGAHDQIPQQIYHYRYEQKEPPITLYWDDPARSLPTGFESAG